MKFSYLRPVIAACFAVSAVSPAFAYTPPIDLTPYNQALRSPTSIDDGAHGYFTAGAVTRVNCVVRGAGLTAQTTFNIDAPPGVNQYGEARQASFIGTVSGYQQDYYNLPIDYGTGYSPTSPPVVTVASFAGTTSPSSCAANVSSTPSLWNRLSPGGVSTGQSWQMISSTTGSPKWVRVPVSGFLNEAVGGAAPLLAIGTKTHTKSYTGPLFACLIPGSATTVDIAQNAAGEADPASLQSYLSANSLSSCNAVKWYNNDGSGNNALAGYNATGVSIPGGGGGTGYTANQSALTVTTTAAAMTAAGATCLPDWLPSWTATTNSSGVITSLAVINVGACSTPPTSAVALTAAGGSGATATLTSVQVGPTVAPDLRNGSILEAEFVHDAGLVYGTLGPNALMPTIFIPTTITAMNNYSVLSHFKGSGAHIAGYATLGAFSPTSYNNMRWSTNLTVGFGPGNTTTLNAGPVASTPQTVLYTVGSAVQTLDNEVTQSSSNYTLSTATSLVGGVIGMVDNAGQSAFSYMGMSDFVIYNRALSTTEQIAAKVATNQNFNHAPQALNMIADKGDSRIEGTRSINNQGTCQKAQNYVHNPSIRFYCDGYYAQTIEALSLNYHAMGGLESNPLASWNMAILEASGNSFGGDTAAQAVTAMQGWINLALGFGIKQVYVTTAYAKLPNTANGPTYPAEIAWAAFNALERVSGTYTGIMGVHDQQGLNPINGSEDLYALAYPVGTGAGAGTGYVTGDIVSPVGGTLKALAVAPKFTVTASGGAVTALTPVATIVGPGTTVAAGGPWTTFPSNPVSFTGGSGTGLTSNLTYAYNPMISYDGAHYTNAGQDTDGIVKAAFINSVYPH